jgi:hypothetical protein
MSIAIPTTNTSAMTWGTGVGSPIEIRTASIPTRAAV